VVLVSSVRTSSITGPPTILSWKDRPGHDRRYGIDASKIECKLVGFIDHVQLRKLAAPLAKNGYGQYLLRLLAEDGPWN
jgi:hypothetical protein